MNPGGPDAPPVRSSARNVCVLSKIFSPDGNVHRVEINETVQFPSRFSSTWASATADGLLEQLQKVAVLGPLYPTPPTPPPPPLGLPARWRLPLVPPRAFPEVQTLRGRGDYSTY